VVARSSRATTSFEWLPNPAMNPSAAAGLMSGRGLSPIRWADEYWRKTNRLKGRRMPFMGIKELEEAALGLEPRARARLAGRLLESLDDLTPEENARLWAEEAERRAAALDAGSLSSRPADEVFRDAKARI